MDVRSIHVTVVRDDLQGITTTRVERLAHGMKPRTLAVEVTNQPYDDETLKRIQSLVGSLVGIDMAKLSPQSQLLF